MATTLTFLPMHALGTDHSLPAARTSMVGGTAWTLTSPIISCRSRRLPMGRRCSFSLMNRAAGGSPVVSFGSEFDLASMRATASLMPSSPSKSRSYASSLLTKRLALSSFPLVCGVRTPHSFSSNPASRAKRHALSERTRLPPEKVTSADMLSVTASSGMPPKRVKVASRHASRSSSVRVRE